jgi:hypothetical protein
MFSHFLLLAGLLLVGLLFVAVVWAIAAVAYTLVVDVPVIRRREWVAPTPHVVPVTDDMLSPIMRILITQLGPRLADVGFQRVGALHAAGFSGSGAWTQILYVNRETGERASFMQSARDGDNTANLVMATELESVNTVITGLPPGPVMVGEDVSGLFPELLVRHRQRLAEAVGHDDSMGPRPRGLLPEPGREFEWLTQRVELAARGAANASNYRFDPRRGVFTLSWPAVLRLAFRRRRTPTGSRGFEVVARTGATGWTSRFPSPACTPHRRV